ncbi:NAD(P)/FAD-dependent oxidoreductase [Priestia endophytica]|uniref:NADH dehydrogenase n=1 Tax=Priestia endophytica DSM 13796 TaxID=1121089 RepID=A0A1I6A344_9BACI|nr:NAD(P)/FAD-dependent oxidoreductase [Priestia endophytica]KYG28334.1 NADH dehydrogenase [Priestia endophytica]MBG9810547.1 NADH dehydrogenase [Priestia endophytica]SFQ63154.1 NADH dehydrogenase [Priestia endophytica DSM 13796]
MKKPKVVVLGAGYGGIMTTIHLQKQLGVNEAEITLINKNDYHYETTWLHEVSAGTLHHDRARVSVTDLINKNKVTFMKDTVTDINIEQKKVILKNNQEIEYDYLVIALGYESETFGIKGLKEHAFSISNINTARQIREHLDYTFATYNNLEEKPEGMMTIIVGGAGFTGIEFVAEIANRVPKLCKEFDIPRDTVRIICVEAAPTALPGFDPQLIEYAVTQLERKGVEFKIGTMIKECTPEGIIVSKDDQTEEIKSKTVVWAAGVRGSHIIEKTGIENNRCRVKVGPDLRAPGAEGVFIVGDCSLVINDETDKPYPPTAQVAMQQGPVAAKNITTLIKGGTELQTFKPDLKGTVCSLGHDDAIGVVFGRKLFGTSASAMKKVVDNRALFLEGGPGLLLKKGKFNFF